MLKNTGRRRAQIHKIRLTAFQRTNTRASGTLIARYSTPMLSQSTKLRSTNEHLNKVPSTKVIRYGQCKYVIAGAKQTSNGAVKNNFLLLPAVLSKCNCCPDFPQLDQKTKSAQTRSLRAQMRNHWTNDSLELLKLE